MKFILPQGIGDSVWALHKVQSVAQKLQRQGLGDGKINAYLNCHNADPDGVEARALNFVSRFSFVDSASMLPGFGIHPEKWLDEKGRYVYIPDGLTEFRGEWYFALMPNGPLERGVRLENWLPNYKVNWDIMKDFKITESEKKRGAFVRERVGEYAVFYLGPLAGNLPDSSGHNRGPIWTPQDWLALGTRIRLELGIRIVLVGAPYDLTYYAFNIEPHQESDSWISLIGDTNLGELYSVTKNSRFIISYQSGVGIVSSYFGVPTGIFWREKGDSIHPHEYISFEEEMSYAWTNPEMIREGKHLPLIYGRHDVDFIMSEILRRGW